MDDVPDSSRFRATSEPPPDLDDDIDVTGLPSSSSRPDLGKLSVLPVQEYSWEWGAFPQPSPMKTTFGFGAGPIVGNGDLFGQSRAKTWGKSASKHNSKRLGGLSLGTLDPVGENEGKGTRSRSVPPDVDGSPSRLKKDRRPLPHLDPDSDIGEALDRIYEGQYGSGGRLSNDPSDPTVFILRITQQRIEFELSIMYSEEDPSSTASDLEDGGRGRRNREGSSGGVLAAVDLTGIDEMERARRFDEGKVTFERFISEENLVNDPRLVIRWAGDQYVLSSFFSLF